jgi:ATP-dependent helicase/nuclease subunit B
LKIIFGLDLDGYQDQAARDRFNELVCGPAGLLDRLEVRLGLGSNPASAAVRIAQYRVLLEQAASVKPRFYSASFAKDGFSVAETLLHWRDQLILGGWDPSSKPPVDSPRIWDLADVEKLASADLSPGLGDRIRKVLEELDRREPKLTGVEVVDDREHLPLLLRNLLVKLGASFGFFDGTTFRPQERSRASQATLPQPAAPNGTDLRKIQDALVSRTEVRPITLANDGSITFITAYSEVTLAQYAAQMLRKSRLGNLSTTIVARSECLHLDIALRSVDEPVLSFSERSTQRPVLQTLALALALRWEPLDPRDLLAFLVHPVNPMNNRLRDKLASAVAGRPGIGGTDWNHAIEEHQAYLKTKFASDADGLRAAMQHAEKSLRKWILTDRFDARRGAPGGELAATCAAVASWAITAITTKDLSPALRAQYGQLASLASDLVTILKPLLAATRVQLDRLVDQVIGTGIRCTHVVAEAGHAHWVSSAGAFLEPADTVLWWDFRGSAAAPQSPWTIDETEQLNRAGVELLSITTRYTRESYQILRPILGAKQQLILICPRTAGNQPAIHHPLQDRIQAMMDVKLPIFDLDRHLTDPSADVADFAAPELGTFSRRQLPEVKRWWKLATGPLLRPNDVESFTSADKFISNPAAWVLRYKAQLKAGRVFRNELSGGPRQKGNLLHRISERLFITGASINWETASDECLDHWLESEWQKLLPEEGANLLLPGNRAAADRLLDEAKRSIRRLIGHLRAASVVKATANFTPPDAVFTGGKLRGFIDVLVENKAGSTAVIDLKYGGEKFKREELNNNLQLQLAIYGYLVAGTTRWPESAFFILRESLLLAQHNCFFPDAEVVGSRLMRSGLEECWKEFEALWQWRRGLLDQGWIECAVSEAGPPNGAWPPPGSMAPVQRWQLDKKIDDFSEFGNLTGWEENL